MALGSMADGALSPSTGPQTVRPGPAPLSIQTSKAELSNGQSMVLIQFLTAFGTAIYFLEPDAADSLAEALGKAASMARSGLVLPA